MTKQWIGDVPNECQLCRLESSIDDSFIDGKTKQGPWAIMCETCHDIGGLGLGTGLGQKYTWSSTDRAWLQTATSE